ncbi:MAG TPA: M23 family metallopeptidase [Usitatibacter sp.]|nr:M23 family metallopeptidase [Usitatibacter sp.]
MAESTPRTPRERRMFGLFAAAFGLFIVAFLGHSAYRWHGARAADRERLQVWLPFAAGERAHLAQGPMGAHTHGNEHAWDFVLPEGRPVVAAAEGRVIRVIDDRARTGSNNFDDTNQVFVDHGGGLFGTYLHHRTGSARVAPGQVIAAGTQLAEVGAVGTTGPHIHFDVRGPSWRQTHDLRFRTRAQASGELKQGSAHVSSTPAPGAPPKAFRDSTLDRDAFAANGVRFFSKRGHVIPLAFLVDAERTVTYRGKVGRDIRGVHFFLWRDSQPSEYSATAWLYDGGRFELQVRVPAGSRGPRWYRITTEGPDGRLANAATLPVLIR